MIPVILSGGSGSRLWPQSRKAYPKQFLPLIDPKHTLIQETAIRLEGLTSFPPLVVCNESHRFLVAEQLSQVGAAPDAILLEPCARNTAPAVALSALYAQKHYDDPVMLILPADHVIEDVATFQQSIKAGKEAAEKGLLVTFGIVPTRPETGYGYIESGPPKEGLKDTFSVNRFTEKPDLPTAEEFIVQGNYFWNSGMFMFRASTVITELREFSPKILHHCERALETASHDRDFTWVDQDAFSECPDDSIDYAVMEKTASSVVIPMDAGWSDVGSWQSLWEIKEKDMAGNAIQGEVIAIDSRNCLIQGGRRLVAAIGVDDLVIVESDDAVMVASKARSQDVKKLVEELESQGHSHHLSHRQIYRPWGHYDSIDQGDRFQVKRITVKPGEKLSLQMHHHRAEHWVVVRGTAKVTCGDKELLLSENQSTFIPLGTKHRLENPGKVDLEIIEVQSGAYLGEDDIVRFDDNYGRCE